MYYIIIRYSNQCFAEQSYLFFYLFSFIFYLETTILEKREERREKSEENKKKRQFSAENCRFFLVDLRRFELPTPTMRMWCAPNCATSPYGKIISPGDGLSRMFLFEKNRLFVFLGLLFSFCML